MQALAEHVQAEVEAEQVCACAHIIYSYATELDLHSEKSKEQQSVNASELV